MVGAGFISFTILNSILSLGAKLTIVEIAPRILPRMVDATGAELVEGWLEGARRRRSARSAKLTKIEDAKGRKRLKFAAGRTSSPTSSSWRPASGPTSSG